MLNLEALNSEVLSSKISMPKVLMIDNYDSFTYNVLYMLSCMGVDFSVVPNDVSLQHLKELHFSHLIISPGPSHPLDSGVSLEAISYFAQSKKILGICLGHQAIAQVFGGKVSPLANPSHGKTSALRIVEESVLFRGVESGVLVALYHSLHVEQLGACKALAYDDRGVVMALKALEYECYGVQFHPESILQEKGKNIIENFLSL